MTDARGGAGQSRATRRSRAAAAPMGSGRRSRRQKRDWAGASADVEKGEGKVTDQRASSGMGAIQRSPADSEENGGASGVIRCARRESNPRPLPSEGSALSS
jgi:hypothetical protein